MAEALTLPLALSEGITLRICHRVDVPNKHYCKRVYSTRYGQATPLHGRLSAVCLSRHALCQCCDVLSNI